MESFYATLLLVSAAKFSPSLAAGLSFGNSTHVTDYAAFQRPGSVIEAYCAAPVGFDSSILYFTLGSSEAEYSAAATPHFVSIVDRVKIKLTWPLNGSMADQTMYLYCRLRGQTDWPVLSQDQSAYVIYVNNGPSLVEEPLSCIATVKWTSSTGGQATVECNLTRSAHTRFNTAANYSVYATAGTSLEVEEELLWTYIDSDPQNYAPEPLTFSFNRDSSTIISSDSIHFKVVLFERLSGRTVTAFQILRVLDSLTLPMDTLSWSPFGNGTGFVLTLHAGLLVRQCTRQRTYMAVVNVTASLDAGSVTSGSVTLLCDPCTSSGNCSAALGGLVPAEHYSVALQQRLLSGEPASLLPLATPLPGTLLQLQPVHEFHVLTEEDAPRTGPEIHRFYQVLDCHQQSVAACRSCRQAAATGMRSCQIVRIFWKDVPRRQANGQLRFYQVQLMRGPGTEKETLNFSAAARTAELFRHSDEELQVAVAGGTSKGLPPLANWSACIIPPDDAQSGALLPQGAMLSREPAAGKPCNVSWFLEPIADQQPIEAMLLHCSSKADRCQEHSVVTMRRPWLTAKAGGWLPLERFAWSSSKLQSAGNDGGLCRDGALAVAIVSSQPPPPEERARGGATMSRLLEVDCRFLRQDGGRQLGS